MRVVWIGNLKSGRYKERCRISKMFSAWRRRERETDTIKYEEAQKRERKKIMMN